LAIRHPASPANGMRRRIYSISPSTELTYQTFTE
jgi:hypothetical protein